MPQTVRKPKGAEATLYKAKVTRVDERKTKAKKTFLSLGVRAWNKRGESFENYDITLTWFNPTFTPNIKDQINVKGTLRIDSNPNWVQIRSEDLGDGGAKTTRSQFVEIVAFGEDVELVAKGDPTATPKGRSKPKEYGREAFPVNDYDDDLPF